MADDNVPPAGSHKVTSAAATGEPLRPGSGNGRSLRILLPMMVVLLGVAGFVWATRPKPAVVEAVPSPPPKTVAELEKLIATTKADKDIPDGTKGMILGFLNADLKKAKDREAGHGGGSPPPAP